MMGTHNHQQPLFYVGVDLDSRIPPHHPLRLVKQNIDFSFVRSMVRDCYGSNGHVSLDPTIVLKLLFLLFFDNLSSARELMRQLPYRLDYLWFLDFGLDDQVPDHSVLSKARSRWGRDAFEAFFVRTVQQCVELGLVEGSKIHADSTLVDADASNDQVVKGPPELIAALREAFKKEEEKLDDDQAQATVQDNGEFEPNDFSEAPSCGRESDTGLALIDSAPPMSGESSDEESKDKAKAKQVLISRTDPDAAVIRHRKQDSRARYKHHRVVDNVHGVITAVDTTSAEVDDGSLLMSLIDQHEKHTGRLVQTAVADSKYGTIENLLECGDRNIAPHMVDLNRKIQGTGRREGIFPLKQFIYDGKTDTYKCPAGQLMYPRRLHKGRESWDYLARGGVCNACLLRSQCTRSKTGRSIKRHQRQHELDDARKQATSARARRDRRRRMHLMEGSFAQGVNEHHLDRSRWRRISNQRVQDWLIAAVQNVGIMIRNRHRSNPPLAVCLGALLSKTTILRPLLRFFNAIMSFVDQIQSSLRIGEMRFI